MWRVLVCALCSVRRLRTVGRGGTQVEKLTLLEYMPPPSTSRMIEQAFADRNAPLHRYLSRMLLCVGIAASKSSDPTASAMSAWPQSRKTHARR